MDSRLTALFAAKETTYATAATLTQAILCTITEFAPEEHEYRERDHAQAHYGSQKSLILTTFRHIKIQVEAAGSGTAGTKPLYSDLFLACGCTVVEGVTPDDTEIQAVTLSHDSVTIGYHLDGMFFTMVGCRGSRSLTVNAAGHFMWEFDIWGIPVNPTDTLLPDPDLSGFLEPVPVNDANVTTFTLHGYAAVLQSLTLSDGFEIVRRDKPGDKGVYLRNRKSTGQITIDMPTIAQKNFLASIRTHTTGALAFTLGATAGNIMTLACPSVQLTNPRLSEADNVVQIGMDMKLLPNSDAGDDEWLTTLT